MKEETLNRRERERLRHRSEILDAALELFSEKGYHNVSVQEIAARAEFATGTLYKFFKNKEALYRAIIMNLARKYHRILKEALTDQEVDILTTLQNYIMAKAQVFTENVAIIRLYLAETHGASFNLQAGMKQDIRVFYDEVANQLAAFFKSGVEKKVFRELDPYYMAVALEGITNAFLFRWMENPDRHPYEDNVKVVTDMFLGGVLAK